MNLKNNMANSLNNFKNNNVSNNINNTLNKIYFSIEYIDTSDSKYINFNACDYTNLEKTYVKNLIISINRAEHAGALIYDRRIGTINITHFDFEEALRDQVNIKELLDAEGESTSDIYNVIIENFNKDYYKLFRDQEKGNIANITMLEIDKKYQSAELIKYILKNLDKILYHLFGLKTSTILSLKKFPYIETEEEMLDIYTKIGFIEINNNNMFIAKNIYRETNDNENAEDRVVFNGDFANKVKNLEIDTEVLNKLRSSVNQRTTITRIEVFNKKCINNCQSTF